MPAGVRRAGLVCRLSLALMAPQLNACAVPPLPSDRAFVLIGGIKASSRAGALALRGAEIATRAAGRRQPGRHLQVQAKGDGSRRRR